jgi:hypothetical protein
MKVKVIKPFKDKYKKVVYQKGQEIEVTRERYEELTSAALGPFVEITEQKKTVTPKKTAAKKNKK